MGVRAVAGDTPDGFLGYFRGFYNGDRQVVLVLVRWNERLEGVVRLLEVLQTLVNE